MGGTSSSNQQSTQQSQTTPYAAAQPGLNNLLGSLTPSASNLGVTPDVTSAFNQLISNAQQPNTLGAPSVAAGQQLLNGGQNYGTATGILNNAYGTTQNALSPYTSGNAFDPSSNPALASQLNTVSQDVSNSVNPLFAAAGRFASPDQAQALARGITQGSAPILQNAATNQLSAINSLQGAAGNTASGLGSLDASQAGILGAGINAAPQAYNNQNFGPQQQLAASIAQGQLPLQNAGLLSSIFGPLAAQFGQTNASGTQQGQQQMSGAQQFAALGQGAAGFGKFLFG